jgi:hypothetical protein
LFCWLTFDTRPCILNFIWFLLLVLIHWFLLLVLIQCLVHQNNRSAKYAAGTGDFRHYSNPVLRDVLMKAHNIIARVHRSEHRIKVVWTKTVLPIPSVVTRWDLSNLEVAPLNRIMGDFNTALNLLMDDHDRHLLTNKDGEEVEHMEFIFTLHDKIILRQFGCGTEPCLLLSKFFQLNEPTSHETLFVVVAHLAQMRETSFQMFGDISHAKLPDLSKRTKTVYVVAVNHFGGGNIDTGCDEQPMEECIESFQDLYVEDMSSRCGITDENGDPPNVLELSWQLLLL